MARERARRVAEVKELLGDDLAKVLAREGAESYFVDSNIRRYLEANDNDAGTAAALLRAAMAWREERGLHSVRARLMEVCATGRQPALSDLTHYETVCAEFFVGAFSFFAKAKGGNLFDVNLLGRSDPVTAVRSVSGDVFDVFWIEWLESLNVQLTLLQRERDVAASSVPPLTGSSTSGGSASGVAGARPGAGAGGGASPAAPSSTTAATLSRLHLLLDFRDVSTAHLHNNCMRFFFQHITSGAWKYYPECIGSMHCSSGNWILHATIAIIGPFAPRKVSASVGRTSAHHGARSSSCLSLSLSLSLSLFLVLSHTAPLVTT